VAFRLVAPEPAEQDIHETCARLLDRLLLPPAQWACYPAGIGKFSASTLARLQRAGLKRGWPDILIISGGIFGIEIKRRGARLSKTRTATTRRGATRILVGQADMFPALIAAGFRDIAVITSPEEMLARLEAWGVPLRGHRISA
jgi:hypothetical protein